MSLILALLLSLCFYVLYDSADKNFADSANILSAQISDLIKRNEDEKNDLQDSLKIEYISKAKAVSYILANDKNIKTNYDELCKVADLLSIDEINVFDNDGLIAYSTVKDYVGFSIYSGGQIAFFE